MKRIHIMTLIFLGLVAVWAVQFKKINAPVDARKDHPATPEELWEAQNQLEPAANPVNYLVAGSGISRQELQSTLSQPLSSGELPVSYEPDSIVTAEMLDAEANISEGPLAEPDEVVSAEMLDSEATATTINEIAAPYAVPDDIVNSEMLADEVGFAQNVKPTIGNNEVNGQAP